MRLFVLQRDVDESGISGTGTVVEGCQFTDRRVVLHWLTAAGGSYGFYDSIEQVIAIHGHGGRTRLVWLD